MPTNGRAGGRQEAVCGSAASGNSVVKPQTKGWTDTAAAISTWLCRNDVDGKRHHEFCLCCNEAGDPGESPRPIMPTVEKLIIIHYALCLMAVAPCRHWPGKRNNIFDDGYLEEAPIICSTSCGREDALCQLG